MSDRIPFIYVDFDNSRAISADAPQNYNVLLIGQSNNPVTQPELKRLLNEADASETYGYGSMIHLMSKAYFDNSTRTKTYAIAVNDTATVKAKWELSFLPLRKDKDTPISLSIIGQEIEIIALAGETEREVLDKLEATINGDGRLPVGAEILTSPFKTEEFGKKLEAKGKLVALDTTTETQPANTPINFRIILTAKNGGAIAGALQIVSQSGLTEPIYTPGTGAIKIDTILSVIKDKQFHLIVSPFTDNINLTIMKEDLDSRFSTKRQIEGHLITAINTPKSKTPSTFRCFSEHITVLATGRDSPTPDYIWASALCGVVAKSAQLDPARPFNTLPIAGCLAPVDEKRLERAERSELLDDGFSTYNVDFSGLPRVERLITTYKNDKASGDESYLSLNTLLTLSFLRYSFVNYFASKYPRHKLADDTAVLRPGSAILTPNTARCETVALFKSWEEAGLVEGFDQFKNDLFVERNKKDPTKLDFYMSPRLVSQLNIIGAKISFLI